MFLFYKFLIIVGVITYCLFSAAGSLQIQKKTALINNNLLLQLEADIEVSRQRVEKQKSNLSVPNYDKIKITKTKVVNFDKPILPLLKQNKVKENSSPSNTVPDVVLRDINEGREPARSKKAYKSASIEEEIKLELEGF